VAIKKHTCTLQVQPLVGKADSIIPPHVASFYDDHVQDFLRIPSNISKLTAIWSTQIVASGGSSASSDGRPAQLRAVISYLHSLRGTAIDLSANVYSILVVLGVIPKPFETVPATNASTSDADTSGAAVAAAGEEQPRAEAVASAPFPTLTRSISTTSSSCYPASWCRSFGYLIPMRLRKRPRPQR
jgi:hypothetical protein